jgi:hypothetical protein
LGPACGALERISADELARRFDSVEPFLYLTALFHQCVLSRAPPLALRLRHTALVIEAVITVRKARPNSMTSVARSWPEVSRSTTAINMPVASAITVEFAVARDFLLGGSM